MRPLVEALADPAVIDGAPCVLAELGAGTGYYLGTIVEGMVARDGDSSCACGFDLSKAAAARAARDHPGCFFAVADVEAQVPLLTGSADLVLSVFAPRPAQEINRITQDGGSVVVAAAGERHLSALRARFGLLAIRAGKLEELERRLAPELTLLSSQTVEFPLELGPDACRAAIMMGPNAWHREPPEVREGIRDNASVLIARFRRRGRGEAT